MNHLLSVFIQLLFISAVGATNLEITNVRTVNREDVANSELSVIFDIKWENAWNNSKNHDAVWVFMKYRGYWNNHVKIAPVQHRILKNRTAASPPTIDVSADGMGFMIYPGSGYRGTVDLKVQIMIDSTGREINWQHLNGLSVYGIEMVYIPEGSFTLGSPDDAAIKRAAFYRSDDAGQPDGLITVNSEELIDVGPTVGKLYYWSEETIYNGDQSGPVPAAFPKGYNDFYIMKYELTQGQYADFLNRIPAGWTYDRSPISGRDYSKKRGGIKLIDGKYVADNPNRPMNFISFMDGLAYTDWAALRPITELEYTKAARGPSTPIPAEFVWGTNSYAALERYVTPDAELGMDHGHMEKDLSDDNREIYGASYYWVMDLSGSLWEKVITIGNPVGRAFKGSHGDGILDFAKATNPDWPKSDDEVGGFGYRGGGYYEIGTGYSDFNPHSPIGYRYYGSWSGGPRSIAYGYRAGRSAE